MKSRMNTLLLVGFGLSFSLPTLSSHTPTMNISCPASKEYITTVRFLREQKQMAMKESDILKAADRVSKGCVRASERFIKVTKVLSAVGIDSRTSVQTGLSYAQKEDSNSEAFIEIFKQTYEEDFLNLDALSAMKISLKLSLDYQGDAKKPMKEFKKLVEFCKNSKTLDLPLSLCGNIASKITTLGQNFEGSISEAFIDLMKYLEFAKDGPLLNRKKAMEVSERVLNFGPMAQSNFEQAFKFAVSKKGLKLNNAQALSFAMNLAERSVKEELKIKN